MNFLDDIEFQIMFDAALLGMCWRDWCSQFVDQVDDLGPCPACREELRAA